jgi:hypothetical protein
MIVSGKEFPVYCYDRADLHQWAILPHDAEWRWKCVRCRLLARPVGFEHFEVWQPMNQTVEVVCS